MLQHLVSDHGLHCLLKLQEFKYGLNDMAICCHSGPFSQPTLRDKQLTSDLSALISILKHSIAPNKALLSTKKFSFFFFYLYENMLWMLLEAH